MATATAPLEGDFIEADPTEHESVLILVFTAEGQCVLEEDAEPVWMSDDDDDFAVEFGDDFLEADRDAAEVLNYLVDEGYLDEDERANVAIETEVEADGDDAAHDDEDDE